MAARQHVRRRFVVGCDGLLWFYQRFFMHLEPLLESSEEFLHAGSHRAPDSFPDSSIPTAADDYPKTGKFRISSFALLLAIH